MNLRFFTWETRWLLSRAASWWHLTDLNHNAHWPHSPGVPSWEPVTSSHSDIAGAVIIQIQFILLCKFLQGFCCLLLTCIVSILQLALLLSQLRLLSLPLVCTPSPRLCETPTLATSNQTLQWDILSKATPITVQMVGERGRLRDHPCAGIQWTGTVPALPDLHPTQDDECYQDNSVICREFVL